MNQSIFPTKEFRDLSVDFDNSDTLSLKMDAAANILHVSKNWEILTGYPEKDLINSSFKNLLHTNSIPFFDSYLETLKSEKYIVNATLKIQQKNGCIFEVLMLARQIDDVTDENNTQIFIAEFRTLEYYMHSVKAIEELLTKERFLSKSHKLRADIAELTLKTPSASEFLTSIKKLLSNQPELSVNLSELTVKTLDNDLNRPVTISHQPPTAVSSDSSYDQVQFSDPLPLVETNINIQVLCPNNHQNSYYFNLKLHCFEILVTPWLETLEESFVQIYTNLEHLHNHFVLQKTQHQLQSLVENVHAIGFEVDLEKNVFCFVSPKIYEILGYQINDWHSIEKWLALIHNEDRLMVRRLFDAKDIHAQENKSQNLSFRIRHKNGQFIWVLAHITYQLTETHSACILGVLIDISEQKSIEASLELAVKDANQLTQEQQTFLSLFDMGDIVLFKWRNNKNWNVDYVSLSVECLLGYTPEDFTEAGKLYANCIHPHDLSRVLSEVENAIATNQTFFRHQPYRIVDIHNQVKWVSDITYILRDSSHEIINFIGYVYDVTLEHDSHSQLQSILDMQESIIIVTNGRKIQFANKRFLNFFNSPDLKAFLTHSDCICDYFVAYKDHYVKPYEQADWLQDLMKLPESKRLVALERGRDTIGSFKVQISHLTDVSSVVSFTDITETLREKDYFQYLSHHDRLTGSFNREYLHHRFEKLIAATKRNNQHLGLILIDIDHFKKINDEYGHNLGDDVLKSLAELIQENIRIHDRLIRWGGEEFILVAEVDGIESTGVLAEHLRYLTEQKRFPRNLTITASFGITIVDDNESLKSAIERADIALYRAKNAGRNQVEVEV